MAKLLKYGIFLLMKPTVTSKEKPRTSAATQQPLPGFPNVTPYQPVIGRPCKLTPELTDELCRYLEQGNYLETAAELCGLNQDTVREWVKAGVREPEGPFGAFSVAVKGAMARAEMEGIQLLKKAAEGGAWQAAAWRLERTRPRKYALNVHQAVEAKLSEIFEALIARLPPALYQQVVEVLLEKSSPR
jgi:hypothetical protein